MHKFSRRTVSVVLAVIMVFSICSTWCFAAAEKAEKTAIYFLPSYSATKLYNSETGELAWGNTQFMGQSITEFAKTGKNEQYAVGLDENGNSSLVVDAEKDKESGLYSIETMPGEGVSDYIMTRLEEYAQSISTDTKKVDARFFAYDWRRSIADAVKLLREDIKANGYTNVSFVCHSAGGLLCAKFIYDNNESPIVKVDKAVTLGTPMQGTYAALVALESGEIDMFLNGINMLYDYGWLGTVGGISLNLLAHGFFYPWITSNLKNTALTYEMIPSQTYMDQYPAYIVDTSKIIPVNSEIIGTTSRFAEILKNSRSDLNEKLIDGESGYLGFWEKALGSKTVMEVYETVDSYHIAGTGSSTSVSATYRKNSDGTYSFYGTRKAKDGDGLVPLVSALGIYYDANGREKKPENYNTFDGVDHMSLVSDETIVEEVIRYLGSNPNKIFVPQSGVKELSSANNVNSSISEIIEDMKNEDRTVEVRLSGDVDISIKNPYGDEIGKIIEGIPDEILLKQGIVLEYIDSDTDTLALYFPDADYKIELLSRTDASVSLVSVIMNTLIGNEIIKDSVAYELEVGDGENVAIKLGADYVAESGDSTGTNTAVVVKKGDSEEITVEAQQTKNDYVKSLKLAKKALLLKVNSKEKLGAEVLPASSNLNYVSSNKKVVDVDENGNIKANGMGSAFVTVYTDDGNALENCFVTVLDELKLKLEDGSLLTWAEDYIKDIEEKTSVSQLVSNFMSACVRITDALGVTIEDIREAVGTGSKIQLVIDGKVIDEIIAIVTGDADGNGLLNSRDIASTQKHIFEQSVLEKPYFMAVDMNNDNELSSRDIASLQRAMYK